MFWEFLVGDVLFVTRRVCVGSPARVALGGGVRTACPAASGAADRAADGLLSVTHDAVPRLLVLGAGRVVDGVDG